MSRRRLALLTPDPQDPLYATRIRPPEADYRLLFERLNIEVVAHPWVLGPPRQVDGTLASLAWGYHFKLAAFAQMLADWPGDMPLANPPSVLVWNARKTYLAELAQKGVATIPTLTPEDTDEALIDQAFERFGAKELVIKPLVSAGSYETFRLARGDLYSGPTRGRMVQPLLTAVAEEGELSLFYFGGVFSHAVVKRAAHGDFRVQPQFGAEITPWSPSHEATVLAEAVLAAAPKGIIYARIDLLRDQKGKLCLMELEAIEPDLYFAHAPDGGLQFGAAVSAAFGWG